MLHGARAFREALAEKLALTRLAHDGLLAIDGVEIVDPPQLSIVAFRARRRSGEAHEAWNARNESVDGGHQRARTRLAVEHAARHRRGAGHHAAWRAC
jgi:glutamate/tyrosine decarboxylase-like PLP-dependent enzyme